MIPVEDLLEGAVCEIVDGVPLELYRAGAGRPLLFLHGMDGIDGALPLIDRLAQRFHVHAPSHPGFGASALPQRFGTVDDLAYFYLDLLEELDLRDVCLVGMSLGGWIAAEMLVKDRNRVARAVLGAPLGLRTADRRKHDLKDIFMLTSDEADRLQYFRAPPAPTLAALPEKQTRRVLRNRETSALLGWSPYLCNPKLGQRLHRAAVPTLLITGDDDALAAPQYWQAYAAALPNVRWETLDACGHRIYADQPQLVFELIDEFASARMHEGATP